MVSVVTELTAADSRRVSHEIDKAASELEAAFTQLWGVLQATKLRYGSVLMNNGYGSILDDLKDVQYNLLDIQETALDVAVDASALARRFRKIRD